MNKIEFPIGDWSDDGHNQCETFIILSNKNVEELREIHFSCIEKLGFDIGEIASDFEEPFVPEAIYDTLRNAGVIMTDVVEFDEEDGQAEVKGPEEMLLLWLKILQHLDPTFVWGFPPKETQIIPSINFYGFDEKKRHLRTPGYGLFTL